MEDKLRNVSLDTMNQDGKAVNVAVNSVHDASSTYGLASSASERSWQPGWRNRFPWLGFGALFTVLLSCIGSVLILLFCDQRSATDWPNVIAPNVCLSILQGISTLAITLAVTQGIAIAWWRKALSGASIKELHYGWSFSTSLASILLKYKYFNAIALAALTTKVAIVDGVLFQRAVSTYVDVTYLPVEPGSVGASNVQFWSSEDLPITGIFASKDSNEGQMTYDYSVSLVNWLSVGDGVNTFDVINYCDGVYCTYGLPGAGFSVDCNTTTVENNYVLTASNSSVNETSINNLTVFNVNFTMLYPDTVKNYSRIGLNALWPSYTNFSDAIESSACPTDFTSYTCELRPAVLNYTVYYQNATSVERSKLHDKPGKSQSKGSDKSSAYIALSGSKLDRNCQYHPEIESDQCGVYNSTWRQGMGTQVLNNKDIHEPFAADKNSSLLGIYQALQNSFGSNAILEYSNESWVVQQDGLLAPMQMGPIPTETSWCNYTYANPMQEILDRLNNLMLQTAVNRDLYPDDPARYINSSASSTDVNNLDFNQDQPASKWYKDMYYSVDWPYVWAGLGLTIFVILCILPSYWGFWELGREVSLGPFEIAYAFQGPAFAAVHGISGDAKQVVKTVGKTRIRYGEVEDGAGHRLAFRTT